MTFNVKTLNRIGQLPELTASAIEHNIDIICVEHRYHHSEKDMKYHKTGIGGTFVSPPAWKTINAAIGGVDIHIGSRTLKPKMQPRMMVATFNGNPSISCYSSTNASDKTDLDAFYNELSCLVRSILKHKVQIIGWDMNAQIGKNVSNKFSLRRNREHLTDFTLENRLKSLNTKFQKRMGKFMTYSYSNIAKAQIDYLLMNKKWIHSTLNGKGYSSFEGVSSDHRNITTKICLNLCRNAAQTTTVEQYNLSLFNNRDISDKYKITLRNKFDAL